jgi:hypothetical protein
MRTVSAEASPDEIAMRWVTLHPTRAPGIADRKHGIHNARE